MSAVVAEIFEKWPQDFVSFGIPWIILVSIKLVKQLSVGNGEAMLSIIGVHAKF